MSPALRSTTPAAELNGVVLLDKPIGLSSNAALQRVRRAAGGVKAGHAGSLDPLASGMLAICLGESTRLAGELVGGRKAYEFTLKLGERTATGDAEGEVLERAPIPELTRAQLDDVLRGFQGAQLQVPPMYAALKRDGQPLYRLARRGVTVPRAPRPLVIDALELLDSTPFDALGRLQSDRLQLRVLCSKGTYVRVLGEDIARAVGSCGYLAALRRLYIEPFADAAMIGLEALEALEALGFDAWPVWPPERALLHLPSLRIDAAALRALVHGRVPSAGTFEVPESAQRIGIFRLHEPQGRFCGTGEIGADGELRARWLLRAFRLA